MPKQFLGYIYFCYNEDNLILYPPFINSSTHLTLTLTQQTKHIFLQAKFLFSLLFVETGNVSTNNLESILKEAIASNGVIFDTEEIQCMIDVLLKEFENQLDYNNIINEQPELCQALSFRLIQWLTIPISNENADLGLPLPKFLKSSYWKNQKSNIFFGSALLIFTGLFCTLIFDLKIQGLFPTL